MDRLAFLIAIAALAGSWPGSALAQSSGDRFQLGVQVASAISSEFEGTDVGAGGRFSWHPDRLVGIEAEIDLYPGDFPGQRAFSRGRTEGLFGVTAGPRYGRVRPFARLRPGFMTFQEAPQPFPCILIFPPPLSCALASGRTLFALDLGGGVELFATPGAFVRVDAGDRLLKYPGPVFDRNRNAQQKGFFGHDFRFAVGGGLRF